MVAPTRELFDQPAQPSRALSAMYSIAGYRTGAGRPARYSAYRTKTDSPCDECFANQHEHPRTAAPRAQAQVRRTITGGTTLRLCRAHAALWRERDADDASGGTRRWQR